MRLSQKELGERLGLDRLLVGAIERDPSLASIEILERMANIFGCSTDYLLGKTDERLPRGGE